ARAGRLADAGARAVAPPVRRRRRQRAGGGAPARGLRACAARRGAPDGAGRLMRTAPRRRVVIFSPSLQAMSGVSTHVRELLAADLARDYELLHFQVGSEGRVESAAQKLARYLGSPLALAALLVRSGAAAVHLNASLDPKAYWRDLVYFAVARLLG